MASLTFHFEGLAMCIAASYMVNYLVQDLVCILAN